MPNEAICAPIIHKGGPMSSGLYVQYGCGWHAPEGWLNYDASPTLRLERIPVLGRRISAFVSGNASPFPETVLYGDIVKGLPLGDDTCKGLYCSHVLEHLSLEDIRQALVNSRRLLCGDGLFRIVLPDLEFYIRQYQSHPSPDSAPHFMKKTGLGEKSRRRGIIGLARGWIGNSRHRWMWDYPSLAKELREAGFARIRRAAIGDSSDPMFHAVEEAVRWNDCLGIECARA